jgi:two-component sensor histidine kinase
MSMDKEIEIRFERGGNDNEVVCSVRDNGIGRKAAAENTPKHKSMGMRITSERLELLSYQAGDELKMHVTDGKEGGTIVNLTLPVKFPLQSEAEL